MYNVIYFGTPEFAVPPLRQLINHPQYHVLAVITQPDQSAGRGKKVRFSPVKQVALESQTPLLQPNSIKKNFSEFEQNLSAIIQGKAITIGIVCAFGQILPQICLDLPTRGCINIHASLLPRWRGAAPIHRAIMAGDSETGISLMQMEAGLDTGPWFTQQKVEISPSTTTGELHDVLADLGGTMLVKDLAGIINEELSPHLQDESEVTYAKKISKDEAIIDWSRPAMKIDSHCRGLSPFPGAFTYLKEKRLKIHRGRAITEASHKDTTPGSITRVEDEKLEIQCGEGVLSLEELQLQGKTKLSVAEFLRGNQLARGEQLRSEPSKEKTL